ncbi:MAG: glycosyltransferase [Candidatus Tectimicrobiota bacterium]
MHILQIHGKDFPEGGGAVSTYRLNAGLCKAGVHSRIMCQRKTQPTSAQLPTSPRLEWLLGHFTGRLSLNDIHCIGAFKVKRHEAYVNADIIHFHGIHSQFFSYLALPSLTAEKPAVFTLRDMWPFTGHCAFSYDCERWKIGCGKCPYPDAPPIMPSRVDGSRIDWKLKNWAYSRSHLTIVSLSRRMVEQAKQSMLQRFPIYHIPNGVDTEAYQPLDRERCRAILGIPPQKKVLMFGAVRLNDRRKGGDLLIKALESLPHALQKDIVLLLLGHNGEAIAQAVKLQALPLGYVTGARLKSVAFSAADLFIFPTRGEGLPNVLLESMACGTPMVASDVGGVPDLVRPQVTGYLAASESAEELCTGIVQLLEDEELRQTMRQQCRTIAVQEYAVELEVQRHIELYQQLLQHSADPARHG